MPHRLINIAEDGPAIGAAGTSIVSAAWTWLMPLNELLQALGSIVAIGAGLAAMVLTVERIREIRRNRK